MSVALAGDWSGGALFRSVLGSRGDLSPTKEMTVDPVMWIVIGVIAVIVIIALIALVTRSNNRRKLTEAAELRRDAQQRERALDREHAVAREQEHLAGAAEQEARAKAAEAEKLRADADRHRDALEEQKRDVSKMERTADELDPRRRAAAPDDHDRAPANGAHGRGVDGGRERFFEVGPDRGPERGVDGGAHRRAEPLNEGPGRVDPDPPRR